MLPYSCRDFLPKGLLLKSFLRGSGLARNWRQKDCSEKPDPPKQKLVYLKISFTLRDSIIIIPLNFPVSFNNFPSLGRLSPIIELRGDLESRLAFFEGSVMILASISTLRTAHILLADDDPDDREFFEDAIAEVNPQMKLSLVKDGAELMKFLTAAEGNLPDVIFLDLNMPGKNGKECLSEIRESQQLRNIPVVIYSTTGSHHDIDETFKMGANLFMRKPTSFRDLVQLARKVISLDWSEYCPNASRKQFVLSLK